MKDFTGPLVTYVCKFSFNQSSGRTTLFCNMSSFISIYPVNKSRTNSSNIQGNVLFYHIIRLGIWCSIWDILIWLLLQGEFFVNEQLIVHEGNREIVSVVVLTSRRSKLLMYQVFLQYTFLLASYSIVLLKYVLLS